MDTKTPLTRRTALALTALATILGRKAEAAPQASAVQRLSERLARDMANGVTGFHFTPGPAYWAMTEEQRAQAVLDFLDAPMRRIYPGEFDKDLPERLRLDEFLDQPPRAVV